MNNTELFLDRLTELFKTPIPGHVIAKARLSLLDYLGVTLAGARGIEDKIANYLKFVNPEPGEITAIGLGRRMNLKDAVFLNGLNGHALDFDDGTNIGIIHLGSPLFSVLLPLAQRYGIDSDKFLKAAIIGYETSFTMAVSIQPGHKEMGYHATGTCGVLGIALAVSSMLDFTREQAANAFSAACVSATGMLKVLDDGSELKPYNAAKSALLGLTSVQMARAGFMGHPDPLGGSRGYLKMMTGREDVRLKEPKMNGTYAIEKTYTKPYAACRYCHPAIEAAIRLRSKYEIMLQAVTSIEVRTYYWAVNKHDHTMIPGTASAKMSIPYGVAAGLICGKAGLREYSLEYVQDPDILALAARVRVISDDELTELFPNMTTAILKLTLDSGEEYVERIDFPKGEPENPLTKDEFSERFTELAVYSGKTMEDASALMDFVNKMNGSMKALFEYL
ncbi:MAG: MmgE/PrpD family protein [Enterocloster bolteae]